MFFDNLQVTHIRGPLVEETHYYPYGLTMSGISSKAFAFGEPGNRKKFNGGTELGNKEFSDGSGLEFYETPFRSYDPQIGRFHQIDKLSEVVFRSSPYVFGSNNPILRNDPLGLKDTIVNGERGETKQLENLVLAPGKRKSSSTASPALGMMTLTAGAELAATLKFSKNFSFLGPGAVAAAALGYTIYQNWESIEGTLTHDNYMADQLQAIWLAMLSDPALQVQLDLLAEYVDVIVAELNKIPGADYQVYNIVASGPTAALDVEWGGMFGKIKPTVTPLNTGDIAKIGITSKPLIIGPSTLVARYTKGQVPPNTIGVPVAYTKNKIAARFIETTLIIKYYRENRKLPPMNKMFR